MNNKGTLLRGTLGGEVRYFAIDSTDMVKEAKRIHNTSYTGTVALGRLIAAGAMFGAMLKNDDDTTTLTIKGGGLAGSLVCTAKKSGMVKAYVDNPQVELAPLKEGGIDVGTYVGKAGRLSVLRSSDIGQPYVGQSELVSGEIANDLAHYFLKSEQVPSLVALGVSLDQNGEVKKAGGIILQAMPGCSDEMINQLEVRSMIMSDISKQLEVMSVSDFVYALFHDLDIKLNETTYPTYDCDCSREKVTRILLSMGEEELEDMAKQEDATNVSCHFCQKEYEFTQEDISNIIKLGKQ